MSTVIHFDQQLLLLLNGSDSEFLDNLFLMITKTGTWIPILLVLIYILLKNRPWREVLLFAVCLALVILVADRFSSGFCKPFFHRFRPSHEPLLEGLVDLVDDRRGGLYGFISSHAANTFGVWCFLACYFRRRIVTFVLLLWPFLSSYSRIYLGLHYPGDILAGALFGILTGASIYALFRSIAPRWSVPLYPSNATGPTVQGRSSNPDGIDRADVYLLTASFVLTLLILFVLAL